MFSEKKEIANKIQSPRLFLFFSPLAFSIDGFSNWKKKERLDIHVGNFSSAHNQAWRSCESLMNQKQHIKVAISKQPDLMKIEYRIHLTSIIDCI